MIIVRPAATKAGVAAGRCDPVMGFSMICVFGFGCVGAMVGWRTWNGWEGANPEDAAVFWGRSLWPAMIRAMPMFGVTIVCGCLGSIAIDYAEPFALPLILAALLAFVLACSIIAANRPRRLIPPSRRSEPTMFRDWRNRRSGPRPSGRRDWADVSGAATDRRSAVEAGRVRSGAGNRRHLRRGRSGVCCCVARRAARRHPLAPTIDSRRGHAESGVLGSRPRTDVPEDLVKGAAGRVDNGRMKRRTPIAVFVFVVGVVLFWFLWPPVGFAIVVGEIVILFVIGLRGPTPTRDAPPVDAAARSAWALRTGLWLFFAFVGVLVVTVALLIWIASIY